MSDVTLTVRQRECLELAAEGLTQLEAAQKLFVSTETVKSHWHAVAKRLGSRNRTHMVALAYQTGLLQCHGAAGHS